MVLTPRKELLEIQKELFRQNQRLIKESVSIKEAGFKKYESTYKRYVRNFRKIASISEMVNACLRSDIVYVGDYHTCNQSQRSFLRLLKNIVKKTGNCVIGLELLHKKHQKHLDAFLRGLLSEKTFIKRVGLKEHWVFDMWENFKPIFDFAKYHDLPLLAISSATKNASLSTRDKATAKEIAKAARQFPDKKMFVFIGDLHIAPPHLPKEVKEALAKIGVQKKALILYQNSESIYWKLAQKALEHHTEVVKINENSFCRMHTPPVILQRSYLNWLEHEEGEIDFADAKSSFVELVDRIASFLDLRLGKAKDRVEVYTSGDLSFLEQLNADKRFSKREIDDIKAQIISAESYYIPKLKLVYLSNLSLNHAGEEAAHFIKHICSGEEKARDPFDAFYANTLHEALGFFGSKIINHKRKCLHASDYLRLIQYLRKMETPSKRHFEYETALLTYQAKMLEKRGEGISDIEIYVKRSDLFFSVTHGLGYMLGDILYYALLENKITKPEMRLLFYDPWRGDGKPFRVYWSLLEKVREVKIPQRM